MTYWMKEQARANFLGARVSKRMKGKNKSREEEKPFQDS